MSSKRTFDLIVVALLAAISLSLIPTPAQALAPQADTINAALESFITTVTNGQDVLTGIFVENSFAYPVVQQPANDTAFVSSSENTLTQFRTPSKYGNVGILAHNTLAGRRFPELAAGQRIYLVYGTGRVEAFIVSQIYRYEAISPASTSTNLKDSNTGMVYNAEYIFRKMYAGERKITLQTCIEKDGNRSWGRMFIVAIPVR